MLKKTSLFIALSILTAGSLLPSFSPNTRQLKNLQNLVNNQLGTRKLNTDMVTKMKFKSYMDAVKNIQNKFKEQQEDFATAIAKEENTSTSTASQPEGQTGTQQPEGQTGTQQPADATASQPADKKSETDYNRTGTQQPADAAVDQSAQPAQPEHRAELETEAEASDEGSESPPNANDDLSDDEKAAFIAGQAQAILNNIYNQVTTDELKDSFDRGATYQTNRLQKEEQQASVDSDSYYKSSKLGRMGKKKTTRSHNRIAKKKATRRTRRTRTSL